MRCLGLTAVLLLLVPATVMAATVGENCTPPSVKKGSPPKYPAELEEQKAQGETEVRLRIGADGRVMAATLETSSGHAAMDEAALAAMKDWQFEPQRCNGKAEESLALLPFRFDGSVLRQPAKTVPDPEPLEFSQYAAGVSYLESLAGVERIPVGRYVTVYRSRDEGLAWSALNYPPPLDRRLIVRWRSDGSTTPPRQLYRLLCDGPKSWCEEVLNREKAERRQRPLPPPTRAPGAEPR